MRVDRPTDERFWGDEQVPRHPDEPQHSCHDSRSSVVYALFTSCTQRGRQWLNVVDMAWSDDMMTWSDDMI